MDLHSTTTTHPVSNAGQRTAPQPCPLLQSGCRLLNSRIGTGPLKIHLQCHSVPAVERGSRLLRLLAFAWFLFFCFGPLVLSALSSSSSAWPPHPNLTPRCPSILRTRGHCLFAHSGSSHPLSPGSFGYPCNQGQASYWVVCLLGYFKPRWRWRPGMRVCSCKIP